VTHCTSSPWGAGCIDAINRYHGRPDIPVGTLKEPGFLVEESYEKYNRYIANTYPNRFADGAGVPDAVALFRELLSKEADGSVVVIAIGPLPNLRNLLQSGPDRYSDLDGIELVRRKVSELVVMGGAFPSGSEWNFEMCPQSARYVTEFWPTPIMFSGFEIGHDIVTGERLFADAPEDNPVRKSYELYLGQPGGRHSWDLTAVLYGVRGPADYWDVQTGGNVEVSDNGANRWVDTESGSHSYLTKKMEPKQIADLLDDLLVQRFSTNGS